MIDHDVKKLSMATWKSTGKKLAMAELRADKDLWNRTRIAGLVERDFWARRLTPWKRTHEDET